MSGIGGAGLYGTDAARMIVPAPFTAVTIVAAQTNIDMLIATLLSAGRWTFPGAGRLVGISRESNAALGAGTLTVTPFKNGSSQTPTVALTSADGIRSRHIFATPISFAATDSLHFKYTTDAGFTLATTLIVTPLVVLDG